VNFRRCLLLTTASLASAIPHARAQASLPATTATFDVVSIHQNSTATDGHHHIYNNPSESHFRTVNLSLKDLLQFAYDLPKSQILGGAPWLDSTMFDIDAKSDPSIDAELQALPSDQARRRKQLMVQALLADRFKLVAHQETRQLQVYSLVVAKGGPKFKPSEINGTTISTGRSRLHVAGTDDTIAILARELAQVLGRVVLNNTGISGRYDLTLQWTPMMHQPPRPTEHPIPTCLPVSSPRSRNSLASNSNPPKAPFPSSSLTTSRHPHQTRTIYSHHRRLPKDGHRRCMIARNSTH
jgi:uncharacterized protein (TIGR03435 family)